MKGHVSHLCLLIIAYFQRFRHGIRTGTTHGASGASTVRGMSLSRHRRPFSPKAAVHYLPPPAAGEGAERLRRHGLFSIQLAQSISERSPAAVCAGLQASSSTSSRSGRAGYPRSHPGVGGEQSDEAEARGVWFRHEDAEGVSEGLEERGGRWSG
jgi:hypothetical protein